ncbi:MAG: competence protein ComK [Sporolactobacillus sp.]
MEKVEHYIIRQVTMALLPGDTADGSLKTYILEENQILWCEQSPRDILCDSCMYYGSSYMGRKQSAVMMGYKSMPPICVCSDLDIYFFPLMSETHRECIWISHDHVIEGQIRGKEDTYALMTNEQIVPLPVHYQIFRRKMTRTTDYRYKMSKRLEKNRHSELAMIREPGEHLIVRFNAQGTYSIEETDYQREKRNYKSDFARE